MTCGVAEAETSTAPGRLDLPRPNGPSTILVTPGTSRMAPSAARASTEGTSSSDRTVLPQIVAWDFSPHETSTPPPGAPRGRRRGAPGGELRLPSKRDRQRAATPATAWAWAGSPSSAESASSASRWIWPAASCFLIRPLLFFKRSMTAGKMIPGTTMSSRPAPRQAPRTAAISLRRSKGSSPRSALLMTVQPASARSRSSRMLAALSGVSTTASA